MFETLQQSFVQLLSFEGLMSLLTIILIDITMSGDNAIVIGMATKNLKGEFRKKAILFGVICATVLRIIFAFFAVFLLKIIGIKIAGGLLLAYVVWKFYKEIRVSQSHKTDVNDKKKGNTFWSAIVMIVIADVSMSLDNVLAVAGAANENVIALGIGLLLSIILMAVASNYIAQKIEQYPQMQWVGLLIILYVSGKMITDGGEELTTEVFHTGTNFFSSIMPIFIFGAGILYFIAHDKYMTPLEKTKIQKFLSSHYNVILFINLLTLFVLGYWGDVVKQFFFDHKVLLYTFTFIIFFCIIELLAVNKPKK